MFDKSQVLWVQGWIPVFALCFNPVSVKKKKKNGLVAEKSWLLLVYTYKDTLVEK